MDKVLSPNGTNSAFETCICQCAHYANDDGYHYVQMYNIIFLKLTSPL